MYRLLIAISVAFLAASSPAFAKSALGKPKVAVTPLKGDPGDKMGATVRDVLDGKLTVLGPKEVERGLQKLGLSGELEDGDLDKLRDKLDAAVVVQGKLGKAGKKKTLKLVVSVRGKKSSDFTVQYKSVDSDKFRDAVRSALLKRIGSIDDLEREEKERERELAKEKERERERSKKRVADADEDKPRKKKRGGDDDEDRPKKKRVADADDDDKPRKKKRGGDDDKPRKKKRVADADDEDESPRARKRGGGREDDEGDGEGVAEPKAAPLPAVRVDAGVSYGARYLTFAVAADSTMRPPKVFTPAPSARIEGEIYPLALSNRKSALAGLGLFGAYDKTLGLAIRVPNTMGKEAPIDEACFAVGVRYRLALGSAALSFGVAYTGRHYIANRTALTAPTQLDTPDVNYTALSPGLGVRAQVAPKLALFANANASLVSDAGAISATDNYGAGTVFGLGGDLGGDIALGKRLGLRITGEYNQMSLKFAGTGTMASARKVSGATDRDFGLLATLAAFY